MDPLSLARYGMMAAAINRAPIRTPALAPDRTPKRTAAARQMEVLGAETPGAEARAP